MKILAICSLLCEQNHLNCTPDQTNSRLTARYFRKMTGGGNLLKSLPRNILIREQCDFNKLSK